ncbi:MAG: amidohydrolase family protein [Gemmatimonadetes bacterium]|nr:amidohydrolase family protein [Gemmatimonadota bacterium]
MKPAYSDLPRRSAVVLALAVAAPQVARPQESGGAVVMRGGWLFDAVRDTLVRNPGIVIRGGLITRIGAPTAADLAGAQVIEVADGETTLPGFIDVHGHYSMSLVGRRRDEVGLYSVVYLANGVTSTFPAGEFNPEEMQALRQRIERGEQPGPRLFSSGPYYGSARRAGWRQDLTPDEIRKDIDFWAARGMRSIKAKGISPKELPIVIERAHWHGITVSGHLGSGQNNSVNPRDAILMGIDRIDHFMGGDAMPPTRGAYESVELEDVNSPEMKAIYRMFIDYRVYYTTTLSTYGHVANPDEVFDYWFDERSLLTPYVRQVQELNPDLLRPYPEQFRRLYEVKSKEIKAFFDAGGGPFITLGTDAPSNGRRFSGFNAHREMHALVRAGIPAAAALKIATINGARSMGMGDRLGSVEPHKYADLFVVQGNPLTDIRNTRNVRLVMRGGHVYDAKALLESVKGKIGPASAEDAIAQGWVRQETP